MARVNYKRLAHPLEYSSWNAMKQRCNNPKAPGYKDYGGRGVTYSKDWETFEGFYEGMGERPLGTTLDRIDTDGNYRPGNCRWSTKEEQQRNQRQHKNKLVGVTYDPLHKTNNWVAGISFVNKRYASRFKTIEEAINWRKQKEQELWRT